MLKRLIAIVFIFCSASFAWMILGATLVQRTVDSDAGQHAKLRAQWGNVESVGDFYESKGVYAKTGLVDRRLLLDIHAAIVTNT